MINLPEGVSIEDFRSANLSKPEQAQALVKKILALWDEMSPHPQLFGDDGLRDPRAFGAWLAAPNSVVLKTEFGYIFIVRIVPGQKAEVHLYVRDHKLSPHVEVFKNCLIWGMLQFNLRRVETFLPSHAFTMGRFLREKMGFKFEGRMRQRVKLEGTFIDTDVYAILREEVL